MIMTFTSEDECLIRVLQQEKSMVQRSFLRNPIYTRSLVSVVFEETLYLLNLLILLKISIRSKRWHSVRKM